MHTKKVTLPKGYELISVNGFACQIGFGSRGTVHLAKCIKTGETVAIKRINYKVATQEIEFHLKLQHPNIIKLIDYYMDEKAQISYLILEYAENGTLFDYIKENSSSYCGIKDRRIVNGIFQSVCDAVQYIHSLKIIHRDIKPQNILLDKKNVPKLCDFGSAAIKSKRTTLGGTVQYMAPEIMIGGAYDYRVDIWALGILYFELINGSSPFQGSSFEQVAEKIKKPIVFSQKFSPEQVKFVQSILKQNPDERPTIQYILKSPCLKIEYDPIKQLELQFSQRRTQLPKNTESQIKLLNVKNLISNPQKNKEKVPEKRGIKILSVREYFGNDEGGLLSPSHSQMSRVERTNLFLAASKQKISLKRSKRY